MKKIGRGVAWAFLAIGAAQAPGAWAAGEKVYVQAADAALRAQPSMSAPKSGSVERGEELVVLRKEGLWYEVRRGGDPAGWIPRLFVSATRPVGHATLAKALDESVSLEKASRKRTSDYTVSAATRGLLTEGRTRTGRETYAADFDALERIEKREIDQNALDNFLRSANLTGP